MFGGGRSRGGNETVVVRIESETSLLRKSQEGWSFTGVWREGRKKKVKLEFSSS